MQIEKLKNSELLNRFGITKTKVFDVALIQQENGTLNIFIYYNLTIIGNTQNKSINEIIAKYFEDVNISKYNVEFILYFSSNVEYFSLSLVHSILNYLYNSKYKNRTILNFIGNNNKSSLIMSQMLFTQYLTNDFVENVCIYSVNDAGIIFKWNKSPKGQNSIPSKTKYVISNEFSPLIFIDKNNFTYFFDADDNKVSKLIGNNVNKINILRKKSEKEGGIKLATSKIEENKIFNSYFKDFLEKYDFENNKQGFKDWYFTFYYFNTWKKLRLFTDYLNSFENVDKNYIKGRLISLKNQLENLPVFKILILNIILDEASVFATLKKNELLKSTSAKKVNLFFLRIDKTLKKVDLIYDGIYELAKNIIKHTNGKYGFITFRKFKKEVLRKIYDNGSNEFIDSYRNYLSSLKNPDKLIEFLEIIVADSGQEGIVKTGINNLRKIKEKFEDIDSLKEENEKIEKQIDDLHNNIESDANIGELIFKAFYSKESLQNGRQSIKSAAGFGLMIFMNRMKGLLGSFTLTTNYNGNTYGFINYFKEEIDKYGTFFVEKNNFFENAFASGTSYNIVFPLFDTTKNKINDEAGLSEKFSFENIYTGSNIVYEHLLNICKSSKHEFSQKRLKEDIKNSEYNIIDYQLIDDRLKFYYDFDGNNNKVIAFDLFKYKGGSSDLIRFLAALQFNFQGINAIILYNEEKPERAKKILQILTIYDDLKMDFWSDKNAVLVYYKHDGKPVNNISNHNQYYKEKELVFSFLLYGKTFNDFLDFNYILKEPHFIKIPGYYQRKRKIDNKIFNKSIPLFVGEDFATQMLYFHLLLEKEVNTTIFEHNVSIILNEKIS